METRANGDAGDETVETPRPSAPPEPTTPITVRYWASARAAAGVETDDLSVTGPLTLADVVRRAAALHPGTRLPGVLEACSVLVGDQPVKSRDPESVLVTSGPDGRVPPAVRGGLSPQGRGWCRTATSLKLSLPPLTVSSRTVPMSRT